MIIKMLKGFKIFLIGIASSILIDMFILGGKLKDFLVKANTSDISPYSTDGQMNYICLLTIVICIILVYILITLLKKPKGENGKDELRDVQSKDETQDSNNGKGPSMG
jgi:hypothetical protein